MRTAFLLLFLLTLTTAVHAAQSVILDSEGYACMGDDKSRKQTEDVALKDAKRKASESAVTYIRSETHIKDAMLEKDLLSAYASAQVKLLKEHMKQWYREDGLGECFKVKLSVEVIPDEKTMEGMSMKSQQVLQDDAAAPLNVKIWTDRPSYAEGEQMKIYMKGNKPFHGRVLYRQADGSQVQLLPNPYRKLNYFNGGTVYELPGGGDAFNMEVSAPFGAEQITLYASSAPLSDLDLVQADSVYAVKTKAADVPLGTRGIKLTAGSAKASGPAEFSESTVVVRTGKK